jgi:hypothetical protein
MKLDRAVIEKLKGPIHDVWTEVGSDVDSVSAEMGEETSNEVAMESCIDADRLSNVARAPEADNLLHHLFTEHGYEKVFKFLCKNIKLA